MSQNCDKIPSKMSPLSFHRLVSLHFIKILMKSKVSLTPEPFKQGSKNKQIIYHVEIIKWLTKMHDNRQILKNVNFSKLSLCGPRSVIKYLVK